MLARVEPERASATHATELKVSGVLGWGDACGIGARGRRPLRRGRLVVQRFVRPDLVIGLSKEIEDALLPIQIGAGRFGCSRFERFVQAFVRAILLGTPRGDTLVGDAELQPPNVEAVEPVNARGGKRGPQSVPRRGLDAAADPIRKYPYCVLTNRGVY